MVRQNPKAFCHMYTAHLRTVSLFLPPYSPFLSPTAEILILTDVEGLRPPATWSHDPFGTIFRHICWGGSKNKSDERHTFWTWKWQNCCVSKSVSLLFKCVWWIHVVNIYWCKCVVWFCITRITYISLCLLGEAYWSISDKSFQTYTVREQQGSSWQINEIINRRYSYKDQSVFFYVCDILIDKVLLLADKCRDSIWVRESTECFGCFRAGDCRAECFYRELWGHKTPAEKCGAATVKETVTQFPLPFTLLTHRKYVLQMM